MSKERLSDLGREVLAKCANELDEAAAALETEADYVRQAAQLFREGRAMEGMGMEDKLKQLEDKADEKFERSKEILRMLEVADREFWETLKNEDIARRVNAMPVEVAKMSLMAHSMECREGPKCDVHKALHERIKRG